MSKNSTMRASRSWTEFAGSSQRGWSATRIPSGGRRRADRLRGGFFERLDCRGIGLAQPRRARLHPRQIYSFSFAEDFGYPGMAEPAEEHGLEFFLRHYQRDDGLYRTLVSASGARVSDDVVLYDQAFTLLGLGAAFRVLREQALRTRARELLVTLRTRLAHPADGFRENEAGTQRLTSNSHMHLLEAALLWSELDSDESWCVLAQQLVRLALRCFRGQDGQIRELFSDDLQRAPGDEGVLVEAWPPVRWAWLLLRWAERVGDEHAASVAIELIALAESRGLAREREVAMNSLLADGAIRDGRARLWPQTERIKAACAAGRKTGATPYWQMAVAAAQSLLRYLDMDTPCADCGTT